MKIRNIGKYTLITEIPYKNGEIRQLYKKGSNRMLQIFENDKIQKRTVSDIHELKSLYMSIKDKTTGLIKVIFDRRRNK